MNYWKDKKWYCYGTSMTSNATSKGRIGTRPDGTAYIGKMGNYSKPLANLLGVREYNFGLGGVGIVPALHPEDNNKLRTMRLDDGKAEADLITLEVIPNDFGYAELGSPTDLCDETFCGNLNQILKYLLKNTRATVAVLIATRARYDHNDIGARYTPCSDYVQEYIKWERATEMICRMHSVPCFNAAAECGLGYYRVEDDNGEYFNDQAHLTRRGGEILARYYYEKISGLYPFKD